MWLRGMWLADMRLISCLVFVSLSPHLTCSSAPRPFSSDKNVRRIIKYVQALDEDSSINTLNNIAFENELYHRVRLLQDYNYTLWFLYVENITSTILQSHISHSLARTYQV